MGAQRDRIVIPTTSPLPGTRDRFGAEVRRRDYVSGVLLDTAYTRGYERLAVPLLERAVSFSEEVVGRSPWPEWNPRGVFTVGVPDYSLNYETKVAEIQAVLIPEGTVSVARWLAGRLQRHGSGALPLKICYDLPCHRNEPVEALSGTKLREFSQFGVEVLGAANPAADAEVMTFVHDGLVALGVPSEAVRIRVNDVRIFIWAVSECGFSHEIAISCKEYLDALAECRAASKPKRTAGLSKSLADLLDAQRLTAGQRAVWDAMATHETGEADAGIRGVLGRECLPWLDGLADMRDALSSVGIVARVDLGVVRSHEYYTSVAFEVDVTTPVRTYVEVAGGGRYDKLIGHFLPAQVDGPRAVPSTGFAFGIERLASLLGSLGVFTGPPVVRSVRYRFDEASAEVLLVPRCDGSRFWAYLAARAAVGRSKGRTDIWVGEDDRTAIDDYARARGITEVQWC